MAKIRQDRLNCLLDETMSTRVGLNLLNVCDWSAFVIDYISFKVNTNKQQKFINIQSLY